MSHLQPRSAGGEVRRLVDELFAVIDAGHTPARTHMLELVDLCVRYGRYRDAKRILAWVERFA